MTTRSAGLASHLRLSVLFTRSSMSARLRGQALAAGECMLLLLISISVLAHAQSVAFVSARTVVLPGGSEAGAAPRRGLSSLPAAAQGPISAALGRDDSRCYWFSATLDSFHADNPQHALAVDVTPHGVEVLNNSVRWGFELRGYGYGAERLAVSMAAPRAKTNRIEFKRGTLTEWYINGPLGLEQGFTLARPPGKSNGRPLTVALTLSGNLTASLDAGRTTLSLAGHDGRTALRFGGLVAHDAVGLVLPGWFELHGADLLLQVDDAGAQYPLIVDPVVEQAEVTASDGATGDLFGVSVALSSDGSTALVGAYLKTVGVNSQQGAAYVFTRSSGIWSQQQELTPSDGAANYHFGYGVALSSDGNTALVGAYGKTVAPYLAAEGAAYVFSRSSGSWSQQQELTAPDGVDYDAFGASVALSGDGNTAAVGASGKTVGQASQQGAVYKFTRSGGSWDQQQELTASDGRPKIPSDVL